MRRTRTIKEHLNMGQQPKLMDFMRMRSIIEPHLEQIRKQVYMNKELAIVHGNPEIFRIAIQQKPPFLINDHRLGIIMEGELHANINLVEKHLTRSTLVYLGPGTIISPIEFHKNLSIYGVVLFNDFLMPFGNGQMPSAFNGQIRDFQLHVGNNEINTAKSIIDTLWNVVHQPKQMHHYDGLYHRHATILQETQSREQTIYDRFIYLVNQFCTTEHHIAFYAQKMCLTERYLGTLIRQVSGTTAKQWIDRAIITRIKVELRHTDKPIWQIAEEMHFPNTAFFCKYFKRLTNTTPNNFRTKCQ